MSATGANAKKGASTLELLLVFSLIALFGVTMVTLILSGGDVYQRIVEREQSQGNARIAISYVGVLIRQSDVSGGVQVRPTGIDGRDGLALLVRGEGQDYTRWVYFDDGALWECISDLNALPDRELSQRVIDIDDYRVVYDEQRNTIEQLVLYESGGQQAQLRLSVGLRSQGEVRR